jgi:hypothetical protein
MAISETSPSMLRKMFTASRESSTKAFERAFFSLETTLTEKQEFVGDGFQLISKPREIQRGDYLSPDRQLQFMVLSYGSYLT